MRKTTEEYINVKLFLELNRVENCNKHKLYICARYSVDNILERRPPPYARKYPSFMNWRIRKSFLLTYRGPRR